MLLFCNLFKECTVVYDLFLIVIKKKGVLDMSIDPNSSASIERKTDASGNVFEKAMVAVGSLVTYIAVYAVKSGRKAAVCAVRKLRSDVRPLFAEIKRNFLHGFKKIGLGAMKCADNFSEFNRRFADRMAEVGFGRAIVLQMSDVASAVRNSGKIAVTIVNHAVPVMGIALLIMTVSDKASADYGVTVAYNGQELGVVSEDTVIDEAQKVVADRTDYFDTGSEMYMTAALSIKPLGSADEVIDEQTLAAAIQEQIETQAPVQEEPVQEEDTLNVYSESTEESDDRVRAYMVTVDGEFVGAVEANDEIDEYLNEIKDEYMTDDVVEVSFDKDIEYTYENYVMPSQIVDQEEIIDKFDSLVAEPVYYEVQQGDNPWNIAADNDMSVEDLQDCFITFEGEKIDDITSYCPVGATIRLSEEVPYLGVMTTKEVTYDETIDYEIVETEDPDMYKGDSAVDVEGVEGEKTVTANVTYKNGNIVSREVLSEEIVSEPVTEYIRVGTRETRTPVSEGSGGSGDYFWPVDGGYISAYQGDGRGHKGIDIAAPYGTPIYAAESGTVIEAAGGWNGGYGNCVKIQHDDGNITLYGHQSSIAIEYGDYVVKGQLIGYVGSTGDSSGNHLHFEVRSNGTYPNPLDYVSQY